MTSAIALLLILIGGFFCMAAWAFAERLPFREGRRVFWICFIPGLFLLLAGWWLA